ncbi:MAG TPA: hypothetical protein VMR86_03480 [Myxococcota bacterium]|nr:hypothetical protein [Myxococcota bacterium]
MLGAMFPLRAHGTAVFEVVVNAGASASDGGSDNEFPPVYDTGQIAIATLPASLSTSQAATAAIGTASGDGNASGRGELTVPGTFAGAMLRAVATSHAVAPAGGPNATSGFGSGQSRVEYRDVLYASGLPAGTPIHLRVRLDLDGAMDLVGEGAGNHAQLSFGDSGTPGAPIDQLTCTDMNGPCSRSDTGEIEAVVGAPYGISLELFTQVHSAANLLGPNFASSSSDFGSTARLCIDVITPGTSYTLDSGGDLRCAPDPPRSVPALPPLAVGALVLALGAAASRPLRRESNRR